MENNNPKISIVVPVYNAERYLSRCIDSILNQTFTDFEVFLVDDGSTDNSGKICDEYALQDNRIKVSHTENRGATRARALGVEHAHLYSYICFVDSDDELPIDALQTLSEYIGEKYDIIIGKDNERTYMKEELTMEEYRSHAISGDIIPHSPCGRLIKRALFSKETFSTPRNIVRAEDMIMNIHLAFTNTKPVRLVDHKVYHYHNNEDSIMHTFIPSLSFLEEYTVYSLKSIPLAERSKYKKEFILDKVYRLIEIIQRTNDNSLIYQSKYFKNLIKEIKDLNIKLPLGIRIQLQIKNKCIQIALLRLAGIKNKIKSYLKF